MRTSTALLFAASLIGQAAATIYVTQPVASTTCPAGQPCTVAWNDDGTTPALGTIGACSIDLCTGGVQTQTCLQNIAPSMDVSQNAQVQFNPDASIGENGAMWFIKFTSINYKDPATPQFAFTSFSAKFTLTGMTGTFNSTVQAEISGAAVAATSASASAATVPAAPTGATSAATGMTTAKASAATSSGTAKATTSAAKATSTSGAVNVSSSMKIVSLVGLVMGAAFMGM
ncbi:hypothetical protein FRB95_011961 [Tulasnella sp. JGI-2019a]|nr:hypothetical protein FRB95_011961 [Tulasnella sp. JGI-2019a]